jgi:L-fucose isomerase-like protein
MPHCNFGTEGAVGMIAKKLNVPTLLWGPRDEAPLPDGRRLRDTLCGLFASSKVLHKLGVPFTYIENCRVDDEPLRRGVDTFLRAVSVADALRWGIRIGVIGQRIDFFWTTIINEGELLERFNVELLPLDMVDFVNAMKDRAAEGRAAYGAEVADLRRRFRVEGFDTDEPLINVLAARDQMLALAEKHALDGLALRSFMSIVDAAGAYCTYAESCVCERLPYGAETDVHGVVSDLLLRRATLGAAPAYLAEFTVRHPDNENAVLLWHAGAPMSMCDPDGTPTIGHHWILPSPLSGVLHFKLREGPITVARFDGDHGEYRLAVGEGQSVAGPRTLNNYVWMEVDDWPAWERTLMEGPFIHHCAMAYGHYAEALVEACKYVTGLEVVRLGG